MVWNCEFIENPPSPDIKSHYNKRKRGILMGEVMTFRGKYSFLSNMHKASFEWDGRTYLNSEAAYQSAKSLDPAVRDAFSGMSGVVAKREGKKVKMRAD